METGPGNSFPDERRAAMRFLILALLFYLLYRIWKGITGLGRQGVHGENERFDEMVRDPQCGTYIPLRDARRRVVGGQVYFFCSRECADRFESQSKNKEET